MNTWFNLDTKGRTVPHIYLSKTSTDMEIFIPYTKDRRAVLKYLIGAQSYLTYSQNTKRWYIKRHYLTVVSNHLATEFGRCDVTVESNKREKCTESCQNADPDNGYKCVCVCAGQYHGGGWPKNWKCVTEGGLLVSDETLRTDYEVYRPGFPAGLTLTKEHIQEVGKQRADYLETQKQEPLVEELPDDWEPLNETENGFSW